MTTSLVQSLAPTNTEHLRELNRRIHPGVDLLELRADGWTEDLDSLLAGVQAWSQPWIATVRASFEGGQFQGTEKERAAWLHALAPHADYVDVEFRSELRNESFGSTRKIVSLHDFEATPPDLLPLRDAMSRVPSAALIKLAVHANTGRDFETLLAVGKNSTLPVAFMAMGDRGRWTRTLAPRLGSALVYAATPGTEGTAPGQVDVNELIELGRVAAQSSATKVFAVTGNPLGHTLSPVLHNTAFRAAGLDAVYVSLWTDSFHESLRLADQLSIQGLSITIPFKEDAAGVVSKWIDPQDGGERTGACNTLVREGNSWVGANTDTGGFLNALNAAIARQDLSSTRALVLGAGGAARAAVVALRGVQARVTVASRNRRRASELADEFQSDHADVTEALVAHHDLIVNATPVGMHPMAESCPIPRGCLRSHHTVLDMVYRPRVTTLLQEAKRAGATAIEGMEMFLHQAARQFSLFTAQPFPWQEGRRVVVEALAQDAEQ